jgi:hypothetical protein
MIMQQAASQARAQQPRKSSVLVAGLGAAFIASAISLTMMMSGVSPVGGAAQAAPAAPQCQVVYRQFLVSTTAGSGTVRLREGSYLSPPITLSAKPQTVSFPLARPQITPAAEVITIEGNATDVVLTSPVSTFRRVFESVSGVSAFEAKWMPMKTC